MEQPTPMSPGEEILSLLRRLEARVQRIEDYLGIKPLKEETPQPAQELPAVPVTSEEEDEMEFELGQAWFAKVGIIVLAIGIAFLLTFPYEALPPSAPAIFGYFITGGIFLLAHLWRNSFTLLSRYLVGGGMALLYFTTLRLYFFGSSPTLSTETFGGAIVLILAVAVNVAIALSRKSVYLLGIAITTGGATALVIDSGIFFYLFLGLLALMTSYFSVRYHRRGLILYTSALFYIAILTWLLNNPFLGRPLEIVPVSLIHVLMILVYAAAFAIGEMFRSEYHIESFSDVVITLVNAIGSYGLLLMITFAAMDEGMVTANLLSAAVYLGLAIAFWNHEKSRYATFLYAMLGYLALSVAIVLQFDVPDLFIWLSIQSVVVVATAIMFQSRFIVVANFFAYLIIFVSYLFIVETVNPISLSFGFVALITARLLNWKQHRLELKTEMMRNAYLASAFVVFPFALYHILPTEYVSIGWIGIALFYYLVGFLMGLQKYRWIGHFTLLITVLYLLIIGIIQLDPAYRIVSFLILGVVLIATSLVFTRMRRRKQSPETEQGGG
ncbi:MAG: DUF2339 domain-containing protein [Ignavibacteria bacterium]|nr:DUF2339 domain-containing protein [Ignavibacteria bacterium]